MADDLAPSDPTASQEKILVLANPRMRRAGSVTDPLKAALPASCTVVAVDGPAAMADRARRAEAEGFTRVIVAGGDGTVGVVARAMLKSSLPLGIVPMGATNAFARSLGLPTELRAACELAATGQARPVDLGRVTTKDPQSSFVFKDRVVVGVDPRAHAVEAAREGESRTAAAARGLAAALLGLRFRPLSYATERGEAPRSCAQLVVANTSLSGEASGTIEEARPDDGLLHLRSVTWRGRIDLLSELPALVEGRGLGFEQLCSSPVGGTARRLELTGGRGAMLQADGEFFCRLPAQVELLPGALRVVMPSLPEA